MMFNIINFNIDNYEKEDLKVTKTEIENTVLLSINEFKDAKIAQEYYSNIKSSDNIWRDVNYNGSNVFIISRSNFGILAKEKKLEPYFVFFKQNYKQ